MSTVMTASRESGAEAPISRHRAQPPAWVTLDAQRRAIGPSLSRPHGQRRFAQTSIQMLYWTSRVQYDERNS
jgi:hypothetical protein